MKKLLITLVILFPVVVFAAWKEHDKLLASDGATNDLFGGSVSISGDYVVIGALRNNTAYIFKRTVASWIEQDILGPFVDENAGAAVAIDGDYAVVGAPRYGGYVGAVYVFKRDAGLETWSQMARLTAPSGTNGRLGSAVAIEGDIVVAGAWGHASYTGSVYVFVKPAGGWVNKTEDATLTSSDIAVGDRFGYSVAIDNDVIVVGASEESAAGSDSGSAYVFIKPVAGWSNMTEDAKLTASDGDADDWFGCSVAINGDTIAVGANSDEPSGTQSGSAYVFTKPAGGWTTMTEDAKLTASDGASYDLLGHSIAVYQDVILAGAYNHEYSVTTTGAVYEFNKSGGSWTSMTEDNKLLASDGISNDNFGFSVSIDGSYSIIGAQSKNSYIGTAYIFKTCEYYLLGDINFDCRVDLLDFVKMSRNWLIDCELTPGDPACVLK